MITETLHRLKKSHWKLKPHVANTPNIWTWKRPEELCLPDSDLNSERYVPFERIAHEQEGRKVCRQDIICSSQQQMDLFGKHPELCYVSPGATCWHLSWSVGRPVGALHTWMNELSTSNTSLPIAKNKTSQLTWKMSQKVCLKLLVKHVCDSLNLQWISCLSAAWATSRKSSWTHSQPTKHYYL